jgi:uncharacterized protein YutE (UPF0331/DUF86 family)
MRNLDVEGINKKLIGMAKRLNLLSRYKAMTLDEYVQDEERQAVVERCLEVLTQAAIDINKDLIESVQRRRSRKFTNQEAFILAGELNLISSELATALLPSATFRNLLTHAYDNILLDESYRMMQLSFVHYPQYIRQVERYISSQGDENE